MPQYKLYYFDFPGLAEPIRLFLTNAGIPFEDIQIKFEEWPQYKPKMPFGNVPVLEIDGKKKLTQLMAILRYLSKTHGLDVDDEWDQAVGDEMATSWLDMVPYVKPAFYEADKEKQKQMILKAVEEFVKPRLKTFNERFGEIKTEYVAGKKTTWCDFVIYYFLRTLIRDFLKVPLDLYPDLVNYIQKMENLPKVKEWHANHPSEAIQKIESLSKTKEFQTRTKQ